MRRTNRLIIAGAMLLGLLVSAAPAAAASNDQTSPSDVTPFIVGGRDASQPYPGMASLQLDHRGDPNWHTCGAVLVHPRYAVTNAHCVTNPDGSAKDPSLYHLRIGSHNLTSGGVIRRVTKVLPHAEWDWATGTDRVADIAALKLATPVWLPPFAIAPRADHGVTRILGWGSTKPSGEGPLPATLQELDTRLLPAEQCAAAGITEGEICINNQGGTTGPCYGDSGSPALQRLTAKRWVAIGGASRETNPVCGAGPAVYTSLTYFRTWITVVIATGKVPPRTTSAKTASSSATGHGLHWAGPN